MKKQFHESLHKLILSLHRLNIFAVTWMNYSYNFGFIDFFIKENVVSNVFVVLITLIIVSCLYLTFKLYSFAQLLVGRLSALMY